MLIFIFKSRKHFDFDLKYKSFINTKKT